jgi:predicted nucleic acid-binding protein
MELYFGAYRSKKTTGKLAKVRAIENGFEIISVSSECAEIFGMLKASLKKSGSSLDDFDLIMASCAMTSNLTLVTNHVKHFERIDGLKLANWTVYPE